MKLLFYLLKSDKIRITTLYFHDGLVKTVLLNKH